MGERSPLPVRVPLTPQKPGRTRESSPPALRKAFRNRASMRRLLGWVVALVVLAIFVIPQACWMASMLVRPSTTKGHGALPRIEATDERKLAVMVPAHGGDLRKALKSLSAWPKACSQTTLRHVDLILYYAGSDDDEGWDDSVLPELERTGGRCFLRTSVIFGNLNAEVRARSKPHLLATLHPSQRTTTQLGRKNFRTFSLYSSSRFFISFSQRLQSHSQCRYGLCRSQGLGRFFLLVGSVRRPEAESSGRSCRAFTFSQSNHMIPQGDV